MNRMKWIRTLVLALPTLVFATSNMRLWADGPKTTSQKPQHPNVDVSLTNGALAGSIIDPSGDTLKGAEVVIKQRGIEIARTVTDRNGQFTIEDVKAGVYQVSSGNTDRVFRVWSEKAAPPEAFGRALMMVGRTDGRGLSGAEARCAIIHSKVDQLKEEIEQQRPHSN